MIATIGMLDRDSILGVLAQAKQLLTNVGVEIESTRVLDLLESHGARIDREKKRAFLDESLVNSCLESVPKELTLYDRDLEAVAQLGNGKSYFIPGSSALFVLDPKSQKPREATRDDLTAMARLTEQLPAFPIQSTAVVPADVPKKVADRVRLYHALVGCKKPIVTGTFEQDGFAPMVQMLEAVRGSKEELEKYPLAVFDCCSVAPLMWPMLTLGVLTECAKLGIPAELIAVPLCGATGPVTLHGALVQMVAENLSGAVIHQCTRTGAPLIWGGCPMAFDMRFGTTLTGAPETMLLNAASAQVASHLEIPSHGYLALSDSKKLDMQAGSETAMGAATATLCGMNMVSGAGMTNFIGVQSLEKLVFDADICEAAMRLRTGIEFHPDDNIDELFKEAISGKGFLSMKHTRRNYRQELATPSALIDREPGAGNSEDLNERCISLVQKLVSIETNPLRKEVGAALIEIIDRELASA